MNDFIRMRNNVEETNVAGAWIPTGLFEFLNRDEIASWVEHFYDEDKAWDVTKALCVRH